MKGKGEKESNTHLNAEFQRIASRDKKAFLKVNNAINRGKQQNGKDQRSKDLNDPDNHDGVITHLEADILEYEVKWVLGSITANKASGCD